MFTISQSSGDLAQKYFLFNVMGGILVIVSYLLFIPVIPTKRLWAGFSTSVKWMVSASILLASIAYIAAYIMIHRDPSIIMNGSMFWVGLVLFFLGAAMWAPMLLLNHAALVFLALFLTSTGALLMTVYNTDVIVTVLFLILFLHCTVVDNIMWFCNYQQIQNST